MFPAGRMRQLEKAQGYRFAMLGEWRHPNAFRAEMLVHRTLRDMDFDLAENGGDETYWAPLDVVRSTIKDALAAAAKELGYSKVTIMRRMDAIERAAKEKK